MKICFITGSVFSLGGIQRVLSVIASELSKDMNYDIEILCTSDEFIENRSIYNLSENVKVDINSRLESTNLIKQSIRRLNKYTGILNNKITEKFLLNAIYSQDTRERFIKYINENKYDIVVGVADYYSILLGSIADKVTAKTIGWQHNSYDAYLKTKNRYCWNLGYIFNKYINQLDKCIVLTNYDKNKYKEDMGIDCEVIYNPRSFKSKIKSKCENKQFLAAGRFTHQKGFDMLIESFHLFSKKNSDWNLVIVGEGEEKDKIVSLINKYNLNKRVQIKPFTDDIITYFMNSSVLLLPSRWEGMPMIVLESLEMGVPIIAYDITAVVQIIENNKQGIVVEKFNVKKFAEAMNDIAKNRKLREMYSQSAIIKSKEFDIDIIIEKWKYILKNIARETGEIMYDR